MREYRPYKHQMGVEGPSFWREQQERRQREQEESRRQQERQGRDEPKTQEAPPQRQPSLFDVFGPARGEQIPVKQAEPAPFERRGLSPLDPSVYLKVPEMWEFVAKNRSYTSGAFVVDILTQSTWNPVDGIVDLGQSAGQIAEFFRIPSTSFQGLTLDEAWKQVIGPFLESLEQGMVRMKPFVIPGALRFEIDEEGKLILKYWDR